MQCNPDSVRFVKVLAILKMPRLTACFVGVSAPFFYRVSLPIAARQLSLQRVILLEHDLIEISM